MFVTRVIFQAKIFERLKEVICIQTDRFGSFTYCVWSRRVCPFFHKYVRVCSAVDLHVFACFRSAGAAHRGGVGGGEAEDQ